MKLGGSGYYILSATTGWVSYADRLQRRHRNWITIQYYLSTFKSLKIVCKIKLQTNDIVTLISFSWCVDVILHSVLFCHVARASISSNRTSTLNKLLVFNVCTLVRMLENNCLDRNYKWIFFYKNGEWDSNPELSNAGRAHYQLSHRTSW